MAEDTEQQPIPQPLGRKISRRPVVVGLIGLAVVEAVAGGITWKVISQELHKIALAFVPPVPTPTSIPVGTILRTYRGHSSSVNAVKWSPDNKRIVSGADDQTVQVWDAITGRNAFTYQSQTGRVLAVAWSPDGNRIASGGGAQIAAPTPTDAPTPEATPTDAPTSVATPTDTPTPTTTPEATPTDTPTPVPISPLAINPQPLNFTATQGQNDSVSQKLTLTNQGSTNIHWSAAATAVSNGNTWLNVSPTSGNLSPAQSQNITVTISITNLMAGIYNAIIAFNTLAIDSSFTTTSMIITLDVSTPPITSILVWKATTGSTILTYSGHKGFVNSVVWSPNGKYIASASSDKTAQIWDATTGKHVITYAGHTDAVNSVAWSPDGRHIASASNDATVRIWDATTGKHVITYADHTDAVNSVAWSLDGVNIASGSRDKTVQMWDAATGNLIIVYTGHTDVVNSVTWSPDGRHIASASNDATVRIWSTAARTAFIYKGHVTSVNTVAWSPDGMHLASAGRDTTVQIWKAV